MQGSNQTTVATTAVSGSVALIAVYVANLAGVDMPAEVGAAIATLVSLAAGYFLSPRKDA